MFTPLLTTKKLTCFVYLLGALIQASVILKTARSEEASSPRLIVVVSVDQFCADYLVRFQNNFSEDADQSICRSVLKRGAWFPNCHHQQALTYTASGHAVLLTGAYPNTHGVIGNDSFDHSTGEMRYCVTDSSVQVVGV
jgi:predicted AlkP superfamily pyrophosphatase or phosphodiesterase